MRMTDDAPVAADRPPGRWGSRLPGLVAAGPALGGQLLNLVALAVPIVLSRVHQIAFSVTVIALGGITVYLCILSFHNIYPSIARESDARRALVLSTSLLVATTAVVGIGFAFVPGVPHVVREYGVWTAVSAFAQGLYLIATAVQIRAQLYSVISRSRLWYGITNLTLTSLACLSEHREALSAATSGAFVGTVLIMVVSDRSFWAYRLAGGRPTVRWSIHYARSHLYSTVSGVLASAAMQGGALVVPGLSGSVQSAWAVAMRFGGGFGTVARYVASPLFEIDIAAGTRFGDARRAQAANRKAIRLGLVLGLAGAAGVVASAAVSVLRSNAAESYPTVAISAVFIVAWLVPLVAWNNLVLIRHPRDFLLWTLAKSVALLVAISTLHGLTMLVTFTVIELVLNVVYVQLLRLRLREAGRAWVRRPSPGRPPVTAAVAAAPGS